VTAGGRVRTNHPISAIVFGVLILLSGRRDARAQDIDFSGECGQLAFLMRDIGGEPA